MEPSPCWCGLDSTACCAELVVQATEAVEKRSSLEFPHAFAGHQRISGSSGCVALMHATHFGMRDWTEGSCVGSSFPGRNCFTHPTGKAP